MIWTSTRALASLLALSLSATVALAGPLQTDTAAFLRDSVTQVHFLNTTSGVTLNVFADYAVYAPGAFSTSTALGNPTDPSGGTQYVYAYEVFSQGTSALTSLSIGLRATALAANAGHIAANLSGSVPPTFTQLSGLPPTSVKWTWTGGGLTGSPTPHHSDILLFTSPYAPTFIQASVNGTSSTGDSQALPTPIPEPASLVLSLIGFGVYICARSFRRQRS